MRDNNDKTSFESSDDSSAAAAQGAGQSGVGIRHDNLEAIFMAMLEKLPASIKEKAPKGGFQPLGEYPLQRPKEPKKTVYGDQCQYINALLGIKEKLDPNDVLTISETFRQLLIKNAPKPISHSALKAQLGAAAPAGAASHQTRVAILANASESFDLSKYFMNPATVTFIQGASQENFLEEALLGRRCHPMHYPNDPTQGPGVQEHSAIMAMSLYCAADADRDTNRVRSMAGWWNDPKLSPLLEKWEGYVLPAVGKEEQFLTAVQDSVNLDKVCTSNTLVHPYGDTTRLAGISLNWGLCIGYDPHKRTSVGADGKSLKGTKAMREAARIMLIHQYEMTAIHAASYAKANPDKDVPLLFTSVGAGVFACDAKWTVEGEIAAIKMLDHYNIPNLTLVHCCRYDTKSHLVILDGLIQEWTDIPEKTVELAIATRLRDAAQLTPEQVKGETGKFGECFPVAAAAANAGVAAVVANQTSQASAAVAAAADAHAAAAPKDIKVKTWEKIIEELGYAKNDEKIDKLILHTSSLYKRPIYWNQILESTFSESGFGPRETSLALGDLHDEIRQVLFVLAKLEPTDSYHEGIYVTNFYYQVGFRKHTNTNNNKKEEARLTEDYSWSNRWGCNHACAGVLCEMTDDERHAFLEDFRGVVSKELSKHPEIASPPTFFKMPFINTELVKGGAELPVPITDHPLVVSTVKIAGVEHKIASLNIWCPTTPIAPSVQRVLFPSVNCVDLSKEFHKARLAEIAKYIVGAFKNGVALLALQEVPNPHNNEQAEYFDHLVTEINRESKKQNVAIDTNTLRQNFLQKRAHPKFGTYILVNPTTFSIAANTLPEQMIDGCAAKYEVIDNASAQYFNVVNFHTNFNDKGQFQQILSACNAGAICLGDTNSSTNISGLAGAPAFNNFSEQFAVYTVDDKQIQMGTTDAVLVPAGLVLKPVPTAGAAAAASAAQQQSAPPLVQPPQHSPASHPDYRIASYMNYDNCVSFSLEENGGTVIVFNEKSGRGVIKDGKNLDTVFVEQFQILRDEVRELPNPTGDFSPARVVSSAPSAASPQQQPAAIDSLKLDGICVTAVTREADDNFKITGTIPGGGNRATRELHFNKEGVFTRSGGKTDLSPEHITMKDNLSAIFKHFKHTLAPETQIIFAVQFALAEYKPTTPTTFKFAFFPQVSFGASAESIAFVKNVREILADQSLSDKDKAGRIQLEINKTNGSGTLHLILEKYELCKNAAAAATSAPTPGRQG